jgi:hypothetical protein
VSLAISFFNGLILITEGDWMRAIRNGGFAGGYAVVSTAAVLTTLALLFGTWAKVLTSSDQADLFGAPSNGHFFISKPVNAAKNRNRSVTMSPDMPCGPK